MITGNFTTMDFCDAVYVSPKVVIHKGDLVPFVEMASVETGNRKDAKTIEFRKYSGGAKFEKGDTVIASIEPCLQHGKSFYFSEYDKGAGSTEFLVFRGVEGVTTNQFVYYFMMSYEIRAAMIRSMKGATGRQRVDPDVFDGMRISLPDIQYQTRIASILSNYDSAIANCRRQIALLEEAAMRLYKEWFKDGKGEKKRLGDVIAFDPPVKLPKGVKRFSVPMGALQVNSMVLDRNAFEITTGSSGSKFNNGDTLLARITPCLENGKTAFVFGVDEEGSCGSTEFIVMRSKTLNPFAVYLLARTESFRKVAIASMSGADGRQRARKEVIANHELFVPAAESIEKLGELCKPMFAQVETLQNQIYSFSEARDRLLPKLMKGEIAV